MNWAIIQEAIYYYNKALVIDPDYGKALNNKGWSTDELGNHTGAIYYYNKALVIDPNNLFALNNKGWSTDELGNHTGAILLL